MVLIASVLVFANMYVKDRIYIVRACCLVLSLSGLSRIVSFSCFNV